MFNDIVTLAKNSKLNNQDLRTGTICGVMVGYASANTPYQ